MKSPVDVLDPSVTKRMRRLMALMLELSVGGKSRVEIANAIGISSSRVPQLLKRSWATYLQVAALPLNEGHTVDLLLLSRRSSNALKDGRVVLIRDLLAMSRESLRGLKNMGPKSVREIESAIAEHGMALAIDTAAASDRDEHKRLLRIARLEDELARLRARKS